LRLGLPKSLFLHVFPTKTLHAFMPVYATRPAHHTLRYLIISTTFGSGVSYSSWSLCLCICSLLGPDTFPESYSLTFSAWDFTPCDRPFHAHTRQNNAQYTALFNFWNDRTFWQNGSTCSLYLICSYFFRACNFDLPVSFSDILHLPHFQTICLSLRRTSAPQSVVKVRTQNHTYFCRHLFLDHRP
jgi:hypothetical protein